LSTDGLEVEDRTVRPALGLMVGLELLLTSREIHHFGLVDNFGDTRGAAVVAAAAHGVWGGCRFWDRSFVG
jgi:hypothetical protein